MRFSAYFKLLFQYIRPQWFRATLMTVALLSSIALGLFGPQIQGRFVSLVQSNASLDQLMTTAILFMLVSLIAQALSSLAVYFSKDVAMTATNALSEDLTLHCLTLDLGFHKTHAPGELLERINGDVSTLAHFFSQFVVLIIGNGLLMIGILIYMLIINIWIGLALILYAIVVFALMRYLQARSVPFFIQTRQVSAEMTGFYEEHIHGLEDITSSNAAPYVIRRYIELQRRLNTINRQSGLLGHLQQTTLQFLLAFAETIVLTIGAYLFTSKLIDMGVIFVLLSYVTIFSYQLVNVTAQLGTLQQATASIKRIFELYTRPNTIQDGPGISLAPGPVSLTFDDVSFGYEDNQSVLSHINFHLAAGSTVGLIGRSGSGKTSMTRLLFRFYDPSTGTIRFNGEDIRQAQVKDLRSHIGLVTQEVQLFKASLRDNLTFFNPTIPDERLIEVIEQLGMTSWFHTLPQGLDTELAPNGGSLSAGESQLLALMRVFLKDPSLIILDEASSRLDIATEHIYMQATQKLLQNRTGIIIAHRLATVQHVDHILVMEGGRILEYGQRTHLAQDPNSRYSHLLQTFHAEEALI